MGISGLLPLLKEITKPSHVKEWKGKTLAVDAYVWLHRGAYGCAQELATGKSTVKYINYTMHRVRMLRYYGVTPYIVFDGGLLPSKMGTEGSREKRRNEALAKGNALLAEGKTSQAREYFVKAVDVTPVMAYQLIKALKQEGVQYVVAPYEADPQLAYLEKQGLVDGIITEDSDLLVFGCRNVLFKLDGEGNCCSISRQDFSKCREYNFTDWSDQEFRQMAILSGCDYLDSIQGLGLKTSYKLMRKYKTAEKVIQFVRLDGQLTVPRDYLDGFRRAELTFLHQRVFDPVERKMVHFSPLPEGKTAEDMPFVGAELDHDYVCGVADGNIDPLTKEPVVDHVSTSLTSTSTKQTNYKPSTSTSTKPGSSKQSIQPAKGAASILNFFSRATPAPGSSSSSSAINPVKNVANQKKKVQLLSSKEVKVTKSGAAAAAPPSPKRKSKFFGGGGGGSGTKKIDEEIKVSVKGKEKMVQVVEEEDELMFMEELDYGQEEEIGEGEDEDAELALREIEMEISMSGSLIDSDGGGGGGGTSSKDDTPPTEVDDYDKPEEGKGKEKVSQASPLRRRVTTPTPTLSSPVPSPRPAPRRDHNSSPSHPVSDDTVLAISSPVSSAHADAGWEEPPISSPPPTQPPPTSVKVERPPPRVVVKKENKQQPETIQLSSDPIDNASSSDAPEVEQPTPRPDPYPTKKFQSKVISVSQEKKPIINRNRSNSKPSSGIRVRPDQAITSTSSSKGKKRAIEKEQEEEEEVDTAAQSVAASWRAKFMLPNSSTSRTPRSKTTSRPTVVASESNAPPPLSSSTSLTRKPSLKSSHSTSARTPLSPRKQNLRPQSRSLLANLPPPPAPQFKLDPIPPPRPKSPKRRKISTSPVENESNPHSMQLDNGGSLSSSPVIITNPKLLAFRFNGGNKTPSQ